MKPISLTVAGLQSFREKQTIPFSELCNGGVFGIFGPTGSGKSTILDAVTLALYGKVERANGGTHGIMNNSEDKLAVSFTFALNSSEGMKEYCVERSYKRTGEHTIRTASCRLTEKTNGEHIVHADKEREVTQHIQNILGLTIEDFTRAVVLPQGKFAEFLSLKGAERRQMLQRLFQLEKYGDVLNARLKKRADEEKAKWNELIAEQNGLGDASAETLSTAEQMLKDSEQQLIESKKKLLEAEQQAETAKRIKEAQDELKQLGSQKEKLTHRKIEIESMKQRLEQAVQAEKLIPYYDEWKRKSEEKLVLEGRNEALRSERDRLYKEYSEAAEKAEAVSAEKEIKLPFLTERISFMNEAVKRQMQLRERRLELKSSSEALQLLTSKMTALSFECKKEADLLEKGEQKKKDLYAIQTANTVTSEERRQLADALSIKTEYTQALQHADSLSTERGKLERDLDEAEAHYSLLLQKQKGIEHDTSELMIQLQNVYNRVCDVKRITEKLRKTFLAERNAYRELLEKNRREELALELAHSLKEGEPCAVCGSEHHPSPFVSAETKQELPIFQEEHYDDVLRKMESQTERAAERLENLASRIMAPSSSLVTSQHESAASLSSDTAVQQTANENKDRFADMLHHAEVNLKMLLQDVIQLEEDGRKLNEKIEAASKDLNTADLQKKMIIKLVEPLQVKWDDAVNKCEDAKQRFLTQLSFSIDDVDSLLGTLQEKDSLREDAEKRLKIADTFLAEKTAAVAEKHAAQIELDKKLALEMNRNEILTRDAETLSEEIKSLTGGNYPEKLLAEAQRELEQLNRDAKETAERSRQLQAAYTSCDKEHHSCSEALKSAADSENESKKIFEEKLSDSIFVAAEQMEEAAVSSDVQSEWKESILLYEDEWKLIHSRITAIERSIPEKRLTSEEWQELENVLAAAKETAEEAGQRLGEVRSTHAQLAKNHQRFSELESMREKCEALCDDYSKLQAVFRGNTFVEFAAEEQLHQITQDASVRLAKLTRGRYAIEVDSTNGFVMRDDANGGIKRPVSSLSGGETFLTSLALALSLSAQIQLRGKYPLEFFFLDEGFGTLDQELLDTVVSALEKLHFNSFAIGVISHVPDLKARLSKKIIVTPSDLAGAGTTVSLVTD